MILHFNLSQLRAAGGPPEYLAALCEAGRVTGNLLEIDRDAALAIRDQLVTLHPEKVSGAQHQVTGKASRQFAPSVPHVACRPIREQWPLWALTASAWRVPADAGVGDTIAREIGPVASEKFKKWHRLIFQAECGCARRQAEWNARYPYGPEDGGQKSEVRLP